MTLSKVISGQDPDCKAKRDWL